MVLHTTAEYESEPTNMSEYNFKKRKENKPMLHWLSVFPPGTEEVVVPWLLFHALQPLVTASHVQVYFVQLNAWRRENQTKKL